MYIQDRFGSYRNIEWTKTDWNCTSYQCLRHLTATVPKSKFQITKCRNKENHITDEANIKATPRTARTLSQGHLNSVQKTC
ncbi:hypothetical protein TNCV_2731971 [Trichonephila clavipes]|nr:hypothetical protein TNCV_2731971 [Trichonephila clavipes]